MSYTKYLKYEYLDQHQIETKLLHYPQRRMERMSRGSVHHFGKYLQLTNRQIKQADKTEIKHNLLGGGNQIWQYLFITILQHNAY